jgi:hypothetical protein
MRSTRQHLPLTVTFISTQAKPCVQTPKLILRILLFRKYHQVLHPGALADNSKYGNMAGTPLPAVKNALNYIFAVAV